MRLDGLDRAMFRPGERVCCAVSGGADSVALVSAMAEANAARESLGVVLSAVHVHHGLRGAEADADETFVCELCAQLHLPLIVERVDTAARRAAEREGLEEAARELRYGVFRRLLAEGRADSVATAHTLDDQAETVMMKLLRGAWTEGLGGISPAVEVAGRDERLRAPAGGAAGTGFRIVRPLLEVRRTEIEAYLRSKHQPWREDSSNGDLNLTRNRVRHLLMPLLRSFNPAVDGALARLAGTARDEEAFWTEELRRLLPGLLLPGKPVRGGGRAVSTAAGEQAVALEIQRLKDLGPALRRRVVRAAAATLGRRIGSEETLRLLALAGLDPGRGPAARVGARLELAAGLRAERSVRELRLSRESRNDAEGVEEA